jgi:hypothetical protein
MSGGIGVQTMSMDAGGTLQETVSRAPNFQVVLSTEADTKDLVYRSMTGRDVLAFPLGTEISAPHRLEQIRVRLTWKDIPFEEFQLEDGRQRVISRSTDSGAHDRRISAEPGGIRQCHPARSPYLPAVPL